MNDQNKIERASAKTAAKCAKAATNASAKDNAVGKLPLTRKAGSVADSSSDEESATVEVESVAEGVESAAEEYECVAEAAASEARDASGSDAPPATDTDHEKETSVPPDFMIAPKGMTLTEEMNMWFKGWPEAKVVDETAEDMDLRLYSDKFNGKWTFHQ